jgi:hypothetical protein
MSAVVSSQLPRMVRVWGCPVEEIKVAVTLDPTTGIMLDIMFSVR